MELDHAHNDAEFHKILILASRSSNAAKAIEDENRFRRFAAILAENGFASQQACADSLAHLAALIEDFKPDLVFSAPDHLPRRASPPGILPDGSNPRVNVHSWLEERGIPYVGSSSDVIELALSKTALKEKWRSECIATPSFLALDFPCDLSAIDWSACPAFPCIVKPSDAGNSRGITKDSVVFDISGLKSCILKLGKDFGHLLIEQYLGLCPDFREITCACVGNGAERLLMPAELVFLEPTKIRVITTMDKDGGKTEARAIADGAFREAAKAFAGAALASAGVRDYSRCDLAFAEGKFWAIEVNGQPMIPDPWFEACARHAGLTERRYLLAIIAAAIARNARGSGTEA